MTVKGARVLETRAVVLELAIDIDASRERVWDALVNDTNGWWLPDFHMVGEGSVMSFDAEAGGLFVERRPDGASMLWGTVQWSQPGELLYLEGSLAHDWGGPAGSVLKIALAERDGGGTRLSVQQELYGRISDDSVASLDEGWRKLFVDGLKRLIEQGVRQDGA